MKKLFTRSLPILTCFILLGIFAPTLRANEVDLSCSGTATCNGSVVFSGGNYSSTGISVTGTVGPVSVVGMVFKLVFDTALGTISLRDSSNTIVMSGTILSFTPPSPTSPQTGLTLHVSWTFLPADVQAFLGTPTGLNATQVTFNCADPSTCGGGTVSNTQVAIPSTPEPTSLALIGSGLVMIGGILRRRSRKQRLGLSF